MQSALSFAQFNNKGNYVVEVFGNMWEQYFLYDTAQVIQDAIMINVQPKVINGLRYENINLH